MSTVQRSTRARNLNPHHESLDLDLDWEGQPPVADADRSWWAAITEARSSFPPVTAAAVAEPISAAVEAQHAEFVSWFGFRRSGAEVRLWWQRELSYQQRMVEGLSGRSLANATARIAAAERRIADLSPPAADYEPTEADELEAARAFAGMDAERYDVLDSDPFEDESPEPAAEPADCLEELVAQRGYFLSLGTRFGEGMARLISETIDTWKLCTATDWETYFDRSDALAFGARETAWSQGYDDGHADAKQQCAEFGPRHPEYRG